MYKARAICDLVCRTLAILTVIVFLGSHRVTAQVQTLVIEGGTLIDGTGRRAVGNAAIVIEGSRFKAVGEKGQLAYPQNAVVINAEGKTVLPGLIDSHVHLRAWMPPLFLHFGVTTVFDTANPTDWIIAQRDAINRGRIQGPRMFVTGVVIDGPEENSNMNHPTERGGYRIHVRNPEEARVAVQQLVIQGVDAIKVHETLTPNLLRVVVKEAHSHGLEVVGHSRNAREAVLAGLKFIEHMSPIANATLGNATREGVGNTNTLMDPDLFDPLVELLVNKGVFLNPTIGISRYWRIAGPRAKDWKDYVSKFSENPALGFVPEAERHPWLQTLTGGMNSRQMEEQALGFKKIMEFTRRYAAAGGKFVAGPDVGGGDHGLVPGLGLHFEMHSLVDAGLSPMQAILSATRWPAELLHIEKDLGTLEVGKIADAVLVEGDPLTDISATRNIFLVIKDGQIVDRRLDPNFVNPLPRPVHLDPANGIPEISAIAPKISRQGDRDLVLEVSGTNFSRRSVVRFDTTDLPTQYVSDSKLMATVSNALLWEIGTFAVTVVNPGSGGGTSAVRYFLVNFRD